ncbi:MAG: hypothetical protein V6Z78_01275 [Holosporaceae bacterium]
MLTPSQAASWFKKKPAEEVTKLLKSVEKAIRHLKQKQEEQKGKAEETAYLIQKLEQDQEDLKQESRKKSDIDIEIDKEQIKAIKKRVRKAYSLHSRRKRLFYNATESSYRKIAPVFGKKAPARTNIKGAIEAERENLERRAERAKACAQSKETTQAQSSASIDAANTAEPEAEQGMMASAAAYISSWMPGAPTETPAPKHETTTKPEKEPEDPPQQPSSTSDQSEAADEPKKQETPKKVSDLDAAVVEEDKESQEEDTPSSKPEENKQQQSWTGWLLGRP